MQFTRLRLTGFKSFVDQTELLIEPGLTGIVGPNGCGKSNLVEALQWVMGETSARRLRGGDMDDVIFGGTTSRPSRNVASVTVSLDNSDRTPGNQTTGDRTTGDQPTEVEVERRIDRGKGSTYRVNGREQRARDVQLLFADAASGAQSTALIGQGRIGWLINAKPVERRVLLEEAAGISGLYTRRHEAELKLSAAETNLARLTDIANTLVVQIDRLGKQARQAEKYRRLSEEIRLCEALVLYRHWLDQVERVLVARSRFALAAARVNETTAIADAATEARIAAHDALPPLRQASAEAAHQVERLAGTLQGLEAEERRLAQSIADNRERLDQTGQDLERERQLDTEAQAALARQGAEQQQIVAGQAGEAAEQQVFADQVRVAKEAVDRAEAALSQATSHAAAREAERTALMRRITGIEERRVRLRRQIADAEARSRELDLLAISDEKLHRAARDVADAESALTAAREGAERAEAGLKAAQAADLAARPVAQDAERRSVKLKAEIDALKSITATGTTKGFAPVLDRIGVEPGLETALGAALGDDLLAATDSAAAIHWAELGAEPGAELDAATDAPAALPDGSEPLAGSVQAPGLLARRLARIGLVPDVATGRRLQPLLHPGQRLVTRDGALWRWDGLTVAAGAPTAAATRLAQRNRLKELAAMLGRVEAELAEALSAQRAAAQALAAAQTADRTARDAVRLATQRIATARQTESALVQQHGQAQARQQAAIETRERLSGELAEADGHAAEAAAEKAALTDPTADRQEIDRHRAEVDRLRQEERAQQRELDRLVREAALRRGRLESLDAEMRHWRTRAAAALAHAQTLTERHDMLAAEAEALAGKPAELTGRRLELAATLTRARDEARHAAQALSAAEGAALEADRALAAAAAVNGEAREGRVRAEAGLEQATEMRLAAARRIAEAFDCVPDALPAEAGIPTDPTGEATEILEGRLERLRRDREAIGPVNLMAETERAALSEELNTIRTESEDLRAAIARLRLGIQQLNREGRERLTQAFDVVNGHFQELFVRLFGGGHAHLEMTQHESDPLAAGIEIMASPPGKKMQVLSLLSGGERALTALALVFAVFLTNPAPICVLDEVDAPLDDANVERFCQLVRDIGERTGTRFLIVTHHRVSMAKMDRLYGVTMMERGISQLVSVELDVTDRLRRTA